MYATTDSDEDWIMANTRRSAAARHARPARRGITWMTDRQLAAYLEARDVLRRLQDSRAGPPGGSAAPPSASGDAP